jgi:hypothetical protein
VQALQGRSVPLKFDLTQQGGAAGITATEPSTFFVPR